MVKKSVKSFVKTCLNYKFIDDLSIKDYFIYNYYMLTFRRGKLKRLWAEPNEPEALEYLEKTLEMMENEKNV